MARIAFEERRDRLIQATIRVIARDGIAAASTRVIAAEAQMPLGALHYVFGSRDALMKAVIVHITDQERISALLGTQIASSVGTVDLHQLVEAAMNGYLDNLTTLPERELVLLEVAIHAMRHDPDAVADQWATYRAAAAQTLEHVADEAGIRWLHSTDDLARYLVTWLDGFTVSWLADRDTAAARRSATIFADSFAALAATPT
ncbi:TetR family transcriptional regulator [Gordonia desulfuricans]|uniref:TetR family transcriptional regulator n=1 Tax=Gordonia desulfuricans TaxID=89051 RepID=A0A7K3LLN6_9ACTN|nr:TetR family transcriptional regulator [Gordonia desulfuricans]NDK89073.1 TetR family transcriptional regulator [Gordonia desulfuricans]